MYVPPGPFNSALSIWFHCAGSLPIVGVGRCQIGDSIPANLPIKGSAGVARTLRRISHGEQAERGCLREYKGREE